MGGCEVGRKINWVKWDRMCRPIEEGGWELEGYEFLIQLYQENESGELE